MEQMNNKKQKGLVRLSLFISAMAIGAIVAGIYTKQWMTSAYASVIAIVILSMIGFLLLRNNKNGQRKN